MRSTARRRVSARPILLGIIFVVVAALAVVSQCTPLLDPSKGISTNATSVARAELDADQNGTALTIVLADPNGRDTAMVGRLAVQVKAPDGAVWSTSRIVGPNDFGAINGSGPLAGRFGYRTVIPATAWATPPRHGGQATILVIATPEGSSGFSGTVSAAYP